MEDAQRRHKASLDRLAGLPVVDIKCLIFPNGAGGLHFPGEALSTLSFTTTAWRRGSEPVCREPLLVCRLLNEADVRPQMQRLEPGAIVRVRAHLSSTAGEQAQALMEDAEPVDVVDIELQEILAELRKPVTHHDKLFGVLTLDRQVDWYEGEANWCGHPVRLRAASDTAGDLEKSL